MPELPEVEATRQNLERWLVGAGPIREVRVLDEKLGPGLTGPLVGRSTLACRRRGKQLALDLTGLTRSRRSAVDLRLATHLGMTGKWVRLTDDHERPYQRLVLACDDVAVALVDPRRFGDAYTLAPDVDPFERLGPDALDAPLSWRALRDALGRGKTALKARLMDQHRVAGLGNIAVIEAAFRARIHPHTPIDDVPERAWRDLPGAIHSHLVKTLDECLGRDEISYVSEGAPSPFDIYARADLPCPRCRAPVARLALAGRPTFFCPRCQPEPV